VTQGQAVLAGEPVGGDGRARLASAAARMLEVRGPELYVEFRKDGKPVDPGAPGGRTVGRELWKDRK
jgi:septal ring factor EnvC (AmiA/AmiB activator)